MDKEVSFLMYLFSVIVRVRVVLRKIVVDDRRLDSEQ